MTDSEIAALYLAGPSAVAAAIHALETQVATLTAQNTILVARVQELENRFTRDSHNSSQPPSTDGFRRRHYPPRPSSGRSTGGQPGHAGHTRPLSDHPDVVIIHAPDHCGQCGRDLTNAPPVAIERRQSLDPPPIHLIVTEHQRFTVVCSDCGAVTVGAFPPDLTQPVQFGAGVLAMAVYLRTRHLLPSLRTVEVLTDLFGESPSEAAIDAAVQRAAETVAPIVAAMGDAVAVAPVWHADETGLRVDGLLHWLHVACTERLTWLGRHRKRGRAALDAFGFLARAPGTVVHDAWASYFRDPVVHALCNAHLLRELLDLVEHDHQPWAQDLHTLLQEMLATVDAVRAAGGTAVDEATVAADVARYDALVADGLAANPTPAPDPAAPSRGRRKPSTAKNLLDRLQTHQDAILRFLTDLRVPFTNNQAERDLRLAKVQQKIAGGFRSTAGADAVCAVWSYLGTLHKQDQNLLRALESVFQGQPQWPNLTPA